MKPVRLILIACIGVVMQSCRQPGNIQVQNNISQVKMVDVRWGNIYIATELFPGETSEKLTIEDRDGKLPSSHKISFKMTANNKTIYLETEEAYLLEEDDDILIILDDNTKVRNPNK